MSLFYKIFNNLTPLYTKEHISPLHQLPYSLRNQDVIGKLGARTDIFQSNFYPNCISEWKKLDPEIRNIPPIVTFKSQLQSIIRPPAKSIFGIYDPIGLSHLSQIRVGLSKLNFHNFKHNFKDAINPVCPTNDGIEETEHFSLLCPLFDNQRQHLLGGISVAVKTIFSNLHPFKPDLVNLLLYGDEHLPSDIDKVFLKIL